jgi:hypothetical protein
MVDDGTESSSNAALLRHTLRMYISNNDVSGDEIETPVLSLVLNGDEQTLLMVYHALNDDNSPVIVFRDTGGAASDLYHFWDASSKGRAAHHVSVDGSRSQTYADEANRLLPLIVEAGKASGHNRRPLLEFVHLRQLFDGDLSSAEEEIEHTILTAVLNGCKNTQQEVLLAVAWGQVQVLQNMLQQEADWAIPGDVNVRESSSRSTVDVSASIREGSSRAKARRMKAMALEAALMRKDEDVVKCLLDFGAEAAHVDCTRLFRLSEKLVTFNHDEMGILDSDQKWQKGEWTRVLADLVDGYKHHMEIRKQVVEENSLIMSPTWTDLTMWAVLVDDFEMAHVLWARSRMPLRGALMASQFCSRMAVRLPLALCGFRDYGGWVRVHTSMYMLNVGLFLRALLRVIGRGACTCMQDEDGCAADSVKLKDQALGYEQWAVDLLDQLPEGVAHLCLLLIRRSPYGGQTLWPASALESATTEDGLRSVPCKQVAPAQLPSPVLSA